MRINVYAEELYKVHQKQVERVRTIVPATEDRLARTFYGARIFLRSATELHHNPDDDDRSAITFWGQPSKVAALLRQLADEMEKEPHE